MKAYVKSIINISVTILVFSIMFFGGLNEHPEISILSRFTTSIVQSVIIMFSFSFVYNGIKNFIEE